MLDNMNNKKNIDTQTETRNSTSKWLFAICFLVYSTSYIARGTFSFVRSTMIDAGAITEGIAGAVSAAYFIFYALGQLINGFLGDKVSPFWMVMSGLVVVIISNIMMAFSQPSWLYVVWWGINGYGHSMLWAPIYFVLSNVINQKVRVFALTAISISSPLGKITSALVSSAALKGGRWQSVFFTVTIICAAILALWMAGYITLKKNMIIPEREASPSQSEAKSNKNKGIWKILLLSGVAIMLPSMFVHGLFYNGVVELMPTILHDEYSMTPSMAAILEIIIPLLSIAGVFLANLVYYKLFKQHDMRSAAFLMGMSIVPIGIMLALALFRPQSFLFGQYPDAIIFVTTYATAYLFQFAFNHIVIVLMPVRLAKYSCSSTVSGIANAINYGGSAISTYGMSYALLKLPLWQTVLIWGGFLLVATTLVALSQRRWGKFIKNLD